MQVVTSPACCRCFKLLQKNARLFTQTTTNFSTNIVRKRPNQTHYEVLGVKRSATNGEIKTAFVQLSKKVHPDKNPGNPKSHAQFVAINEAYSILSKESSRQHYDNKLGFRSAMHQNSGYSYTSQAQTQHSYHYRYQRDYEYSGYHRKTNTDEHPYYDLSGLPKYLVYILYFMMILRLLPFILSWRYSKNKTHSRRK